MDKYILDKIDYVNRNIRPEAVLDYLGYKRAYCPPDPRTDIYQKKEKTVIAKYEENTIDKMPVGIFLFTEINANMRMPMFRPSSRLDRAFQDAVNYLDNTNGNYPYVGTQKEVFPTPQQTSAVKEIQNILALCGYIQEPDANGANMYKKDKLSATGEIEYRSYICVYPNSFWYEKHDLREVQSGQYAQSLYDSLRNELAIPGLRAMRYEYARQMIDGLVERQTKTDMPNAQSVERQYLDMKRDIKIPILMIGTDNTITVMGPEADYLAYRCPDYIKYSGQNPKDDNMPSKIVYSPRLIQDIRDNILEEYGTYTEISNDIFDPNQHREMAQESSIGIKM